MIYSFYLIAHIMDSKLITQKQQYMKKDNQMFLNRSLFIKCSSGKLEDKYDIKKEVGKGAYANVFLATLKQNPQKKRAIKKIQKRSIKQPLTFINEIEILKKLDHPNIIKIHETLEDKQNYYVVTDYCEGGQLFDKLSNDGSFSQYDARQIFMHMLYAVKYCHHQKIAHRDLKPENFLLSTSASTSQLKLIDFGLSFEWKQDMRKQLKQRKLNKMTGTCYYIAPEVIRGDYCEKCDIWSLGVILYVLVSGVPPFDGKDDKHILEAVKKGVFTFEIPEFKIISKQLKDLISKMLQPQNSRITIQQIYQHPWINATISKGNLRLNFGKMMNFSKFSKLKTFAVSCIASQLSGTEIDKLGKLFKQIDKDHDGFITTKQLKQTLDKQKQKASLQQLESLMQYLDTDHNGKLNYSQFIACCLENSIIFKQENLVSVFNTLDVDGNGLISPEELRQALAQNNKSLSCQVIDQIIQSSDKNGDGMIDFKEFLANISQFT